MKLFCMYDSKASFFMQPFPENSTVSALRGFDLAVNGKDSIFSRYPDDFCLMELGTFDQQTGQITLHAIPQNLGTARTVLKTSPEQNSLPFSSKIRDDVRATQ